MRLYEYTIFKTQLNSTYDPIHGDLALKFCAFSGIRVGAPKDFLADACGVFGTSWIRSE